MLNLIIGLILACSGTDNPPLDVPPDPAKVMAVSVRGPEGAYTFSVEIQSPDTGCDQYADWWEVISVDGRLLYRRILAHSHVDEQPFTRSGGPVSIQESEQVLVRMHMNTTGYSRTGMKGSVKGGFASHEFAADFATDLETESPLPNGCAF